MRILAQFGLKTAQIEVSRKFYTTTDQILIHTAPSNIYQHVPIECPSLPIIQQPGTTCSLVCASWRPRSKTKAILRISRCVSPSYPGRLGFKFPIPCFNRLGIEPSYRARAIRNGSTAIGVIWGRSRKKRPWETTRSAESGCTQAGGCKSKYTERIMG